MDCYLMLSGIPFTVARPDTLMSSRCFEKMTICLNDVLKLHVKSRILRGSVRVDFLGLTRNKKSARFMAYISMRNGTSKDLHETLKVIVVNIIELINSLQRKFFELFEKDNIDVHILLKDPVLEETLNEINDMLFM